MFSFIATVVSFAWIAQNWVTVLVVLVILIAIIVAIHSSRKKKRQAYLALPVYFIGNKATKIYHDATCPNLSRVVLVNRVAFRLPAETARLGYRPCGVCNPRWPADLLNNSNK